MGQYAKRLHKKLASNSAGLPTKVPKRRPGDPLPGGGIDIETLIKDGYDPIHAAYVFIQYHEYLTNSLFFPFTAEHGGEYGHPERVKVVGLGDPDEEPMIDEHYGIICEARLEGQIMNVPLGALASASYDGTLKSWDMTTGKERATMGENKGCLGFVAFSPDGKTLASGAIGSPIPFPDLLDVKLWDVATGKVRTTLKGNTDLFHVHSVAFNPDGRMLASAGGSIDNAPGELRVWDIATDK